MSAQGDMRKLVKALEKQAFTVEKSANGHHKVRGADGRLIATLAGTCGGGRGQANGLAELRRAGFKWGSR